MENIRKNKILLVDDDNTIILLLQDILTDAGFEIITATDGLLALENMRREKPDLVILDWNMPIKDGFQTLIEIESDPNIKDIPVIMLTGVMTNSENLKAAFEHGAFDYIRKNFDIIELKARIGAALKFVQANQQLIQIKNNVLTENALKIARNNQFNQLCRDKIDELINIAPENSKINAKLIEFKNMVQSSKVVKNWSQFNEHFITINPDFYKQLTLKHPELGRAELKICALLKLNLSTKEIADITYLTPNSVKTIRARIRKKLGIDTISGLSNYLMRF